MKRISYALLPLAGLLLPFVAFAKPVIGTVSPVTATANVAVSMTASVQSSTPIQYCNLYVDLADVGAMTVSGGVASRSYTFPSGGSRIAFVFCRDTSGGMAAGANTAIWVEGAIQSQPPLSTPNPTPAPAPTPTPTPTPAPTPTPTPSTTEPLNTIPVSTVRLLVKLACADGSLPDDPCTAVYYIGADGKRHAYTSSRVFFTWYENFDGVQIVTPQTLSSYPLGKNVTYRPGSRMVKFASLDKVYAITSGGRLSWIKTEEVARTLYGDDWNTKVDDIPDAFFNDYAFGPDIDVATSYSPSLELQNNATFD
jgi:hypothetical protein